jgi:hypothetical protein
MGWQGVSGRLQAFALQNAARRPSTRIPRLCAGAGTSRRYLPPRSAWSRGAFRNRSYNSVALARHNPPAEEIETMEGKSEINIGKYVSRRLSQVKVLSRLLETELESAKGGREITMDRNVVEQVLDVLEIFVEDCDSVTGGLNARKIAEQKPTVARLN